MDKILYNFPPFSSWKKCSWRAPFLRIKRCFWYFYFLRSSQTTSTFPKESTDQLLFGHSVLGAALIEKSVLTPRWPTLSKIMGNGRTTTSSCPWIRYLRVGISIFEFWPCGLLRDRGLGYSWRYSQISYTDYRLGRKFGQTRSMIRTVCH